VPSRRAYLTALTAALAGCGNERGQTVSRHRSTTTSPEPTPTETPTSTDTRTEASTPQNISGQWTHASADARLTNRVPTPVSEPAQEVWTRDIGIATVRLAGERLLVASSETENGRIRRIGADGEPVWTYRTLGPVVGDSCYVRGRTIGSPSLRAFTLAADGTEPTERWSRADALPAVADADLLVATSYSRDRLLGLAPEDGRERWSLDEAALDVPVDEFSGVALDEESVFVVVKHGFSVERDADSRDRWLAALDRRSGAVRWTVRIPNGRGGGFAVTPDGVVVGDGEGRVEAWTRDGTARWRREFEDDIWRVVVESGGGTLVGVRGQSSRQTVALDRSGERRWTSDSGVALAVGGGTALLGRDSQLTAVDPSTGDDQWTWDAPAPLLHAFPVRVDGESGLLLAAGEFPEGHTLHLLV